MSEPAEPDDGPRFVSCIRCAHALTWFEHTQLRYAVDCPRCNAKDQFGPGVYVDDYRGITLKEATQRKVARARQAGE